VTTLVVGRNGHGWVVGALAGLSVFAAAVALAPIVFTDEPSFQAALIGCGAVAGALCLGGRQRVWSSPLYVLALAWTVVGVVHPLLIGLQDPYSNLVLGVDVTASLVPAAVIAGAGVCAMAMGMRLALRKTAGISRPLVFCLDPVGGAATELVLVLLYLATTAVLIQQVGFQTLLHWRSDPSRQALSETSNYLIFTGYLLIVPALARLLRARTLISGTALPAWGLLLLSQTTAILSGSRIEVIPCILSVYIVLSLRREHFSRTRAAVALLVVLAVAIGFVAWRQSSDVTQASLGHNSISYIASDVFEGQDTAMLGNFAVLVKADGGARASFPGEAYLAILARPIPHELWDSKPLTLDQQLNTSLLPVQEQQGFGFSFTCFGEALYNGGVLSVVFVSLLLGLFWGGLHRRLLARSTPRQVLVAAALVPLLIVILRGSLSADYPRLVLSALPAMLYRGT
jgi:O-antigen polysaccharide polymerase Wzy